MTKESLPPDVFVPHLLAAHSHQIGVFCCWGVECTLHCTVLGDFVDGVYDDCDDDDDDDDGDDGDTQRLMRLLHALGCTSILFPRTIGLLES